MLRILVVGILAAATALGGCGGDDEETQTQPGGGGAPAGALEIAADPSGALKFDKKSLSADAGKVTIVMSNPSSVPHNVAIEGDGVDVKGEVVSQGGTSEASADLKAGEYTFYCSVPGHREGGMEGTLTVDGGGDGGGGGGEE